ncbi:Lcp5 protein [Martiniozyma asiatica (nom. inval.)]|nr:Lcp5 protein [Martiniozyma asiatica]
MSRKEKVQSLDALLQSMANSIDSTVESVQSIEDQLTNETHPELITHLLKSTGGSSLDPISLLSLKNSSMLSYITDLSLLVALRLKTMKSESQKSDNDQIVKSSLVHRVTLEKGVKSLEKKLNYQFEKLTSAYQRREKEQKDIDSKSLNAEQSGEEEEEEEEEEEGMNFKPNPSALLGSAAKSAIKKSTDTTNEGEEEEDDDNTGKSSGRYRPPKITAMSLQDPDKEVKTSKQRNLQSMDEYLQDMSEAPTVAHSIGATIINKGRDVKSKKQLEKEAEVQRYEEENFTRLPTTKTKESKKDRAKRMRNEFGGEDWSMFTNNREFDSSASSGPKKKRKTAWDKAKRKID